MSFQTDCRYFNGYKPCGRGQECDQLCPSYSPVRSTVVLIHLGAMGAVVRSTALLPAIKRTYPNSFVIWVTDAPVHKLLKNHPAIDRVITKESIHEINRLEIESVFCVDKSTEATGLLKDLQFEKLFGFDSHPKTGAILPANPEAQELWELGLDNQKKFFENQKTENQLVHQALCLGPYQKDRSRLVLSEDEFQQAKIRKQQLPGRGNRPVIGLNTGCAPTIPYKKWTVEYHRKLIAEIQKTWAVDIVLLGGPTETERNLEIASGFADVVCSSTTSGPRDGLVSIECCDIVISGDSLGMHMAVARGKYTIVWFGPTVAAEIELFDHGEKIQTQASCSPCWKRACSKSIMCYDLVDRRDVLKALESGLEKLFPKQIERKPSHSQCVLG